MKKHLKIPNNNGTENCTNNITTQKIAYAAFSCDRRAKKCLKRELAARSNDDLAATTKWRDKKRKLLCMRDLLLDFLKPDDMVVDVVQTDPKDVSGEFYPFTTYIHFYRYKVGPFRLYRNAEDVGFEYEVPFTSIGTAMEEDPVRCPLMRRKECQRLLKHLLGK